MICSITKGSSVVSDATKNISRNVRDYILVFKEVLIIIDLYHSLINSNQLRNHETVFQDYTYSGETLMIISTIKELIICLIKLGEKIYMDTCSP